MNVSVASQTLEFFYSALLGVGIGVLYDIFALIRSYLKKSSVVTGLLDSLFWICATVALFAFVMTISEGRMRWYVLVGTLGGTFIYKCTISALFFRTIRIIISLLTKTLKLLVWPLYWLSDWLVNSGQRMKKNFSASLKKQKQKKILKRRIKEKQKLDQKQKLLLQNEKKSRKCSKKKVSKTKKQEIN